MCQYARYAALNPSNNSLEREYLASCLSWIVALNEEIDAHDGEASARYWFPPGKLSSKGIAI